MNCPVLVSCPRHCFLPSLSRVSHPTLDVPSPWKLQAALHVIQSTVSPVICHPSPLSSYCELGVLLHEPSVGKANLIFLMVTPRPKKMLIHGMTVSIFISYANSLLSTQRASGPRTFLFGLPHVGHSFAKDRI